MMGNLAGQELGAPVRVQDIPDCQSLQGTMAVFMKHLLLVMLCVLYILIQSTLTTSYGEVIPRFPALRTKKPRPRAVK